MLSYPLAELPVTIADLEINGPDTYGYVPLVERLAARCGVAPECVVTANGTSMANHLAMATILEPGDEVLIEQPTYGLLLDVAHYLGRACGALRPPQRG
jgi:DNA-binding transcriptional MocR family regulator